MADLEFSTNETIASYGIGLQMGEQLKRAFPGVSLLSAVAGIEDAFNNAEQRVKGEDINAAFGVIQQLLEAQKQELAGEHSAEGESFLLENAKRDEVTVTDSGLQYEVVSEGSGKKPLSTDTVRTHYKGTLINGQVFDSSYDRGEPAEFPVNGVIAGWTEALQIMTTGSKWKLYIPYQLAYGDQGAGRDIGPYQALIFEIELIAIL